MCGIFGIIDGNKSVSERDIKYGMSQIRHRGPDGEGLFISSDKLCGLGHVRLSIIDIANGAQPFSAANDRYTVTFNGEIYNYLELRKQLGPENFQTESDTEVLLRAYIKWGAKCLDKLRGMFAFAIWDAEKKELFCARDRFGIKPFYWSAIDDEFYFSSEVKALLKFQKNRSLSPEGLSDYFVYQFYLGNKTPVKNIQSLEPSHYLLCRPGHDPEIKKYWDVDYHINHDGEEGWFLEQLESLMEESMDLHLRADVPISSYVSGGIDSSLIASMASRKLDQKMTGFNGRFEGSDYDESPYAVATGAAAGFDVESHMISEDDFVDNIEAVIRSLDVPLAGPGAFPQYMVSGAVAKNFKVVLGGQGGDEIFGGYARYLIGYFQQCLKAGIDGTINNGNFVVSYQSIVPNLVSLKNYKPLIQSAWKGNIFSELDEGYWNLVNRGHIYQDLIAEEFAPTDEKFEEFKELFWGENVQKEAYFDLMTHFDFKTLLPALLHVEDRMSMAHGLEARVPFLDHKLIQFAASIPADIKFKDGELKRLLKKFSQKHLPSQVVDRKDKMGFPVPINDWLLKKGRTYEFFHDLLTSRKASERDYLKNGLDVDQLIGADGQYGRCLWALLSLEIWHNQLFDAA
ncbi:MAG: asparagine synthase (glutamine-hydrolyzing) [Parvibaculales bacterium]